MQYVIFATSFHHGYSASRKCFEIGADVFKEEKNNEELIEAASAAMRAILERLVEVETDVLHLTYKDIEPAVNGLSQCHNTNVRVNLIRILSDMIRIAIKGKEPEKYKMIKVRHGSHVLI